MLIPFAVILMGLYLPDRRSTSLSESFLSDASYKDIPTLPLIAATLDTRELLQSDKNRRTADQ
jgi:hypothetical protein